MADRNSILNIEKSLGFKFAMGVSRQKRECLAPVLQSLLHEVDELKQAYAHMLPNQIRELPVFREKCAILFHQYDPKLWPAVLGNSSNWPADADFDDRDGRYPRNLRY